MDAKWCHCYTDDRGVPVVHLRTAWCGSGTIVAAPIAPVEQSKVPDLMAALEVSIARAREARRRYAEVPVQQVQGRWRPPVEPILAPDRPVVRPISTSFRGSENEISTDKMLRSPELSTPQDSA